MVDHARLRSTTVDHGRLCSSMVEHGRALRSGWRTAGRTGGLREGDRSGGWYGRTIIWSRVHMITCHSVAISVQAILILPASRCFAVQQCRLPFATFTVLANLLCESTSCVLMRMACACCFLHLGNLARPCGQTQGDTDRTRGSWDARASIATCIMQARLRTSCATSASRRDCGR